MRRWLVLFLGRRALDRRWWSRFAEAILAATLLLAGVVLLVGVLAFAILNYGSPDVRYSTVYVAMQILVAFGLLGMGTYSIGRLLWDFGVSAERRGALATRAGELEIVKEFRLPRADLPTVPLDRFGPRRGTLQKFRIVPTARNIFGLVSSAAFSVISTGILTILVVIVQFALRNETSGWEQHIERSIGHDRLAPLPDVPWLAAALILPILLGALWSIYQFFRQLIKLTGIGPTVLEVSDYPLLAGQAVQLSLIQAGRVRLKLLDVTLVCQEEATFDQGTDIRTEKRVVFEQRLFRQRGVSLNPGKPFQTNFELRIPDHVMHSFKSQSNRVLWKIVVTGKARNWPRLNRNFVVLVYPENSRGNPKASSNSERPKS